MTIPGWFDALYKDGQYTICTNGVAWAWKSHMTLALLGIYTLSADTKSLTLKDNATISHIDLSSSPACDIAHV